MATRSSVLCLYKQMLRESAKFESYNYRMYAARRIKDAFRDHKTEQDTQQLNSLIERANKDLQMIKRQVIIGNMYSTNKLVIEDNKEQGSAGVH